MTPAFAHAMADHKQALFEHFQRLVPLLSDALPGRTIVVRPHPSERHEPWQKLAEQRPNVHVLNEGNVVPWLMAARMLIHNGCTTAVEAAVLGTAAVEYQPVTSELQSPLPNAVSYHASTVEEVTSLARAALEGRLGPLAEEVRRAVLDEHLAALDGPLAAERIVDELVHAGYLEGRPPRAPLGSYARAWFRGNVRTMRKVRYVAEPGHRNSAAFHRHRYPEVSSAELRARIERLGRQLGRFHGIRVRRMGRYLFRIAAAA
jgi:hypothetical protein